MLRALFREIVLIDSNHELAAAEAADLSDANALARPAKICAGTYEDAASARIALITAGAATHGKETRISVAAKSADVMRRCVDELMAGGFDGIIVVAANPVDLMTLIALRRSGLPPSNVMGTGTLLDTSRLRQKLSTQMQVAPGSIDALVLGEHGDSEVIAFSTLRIGGLSLGQFAPADEPNHYEVASSVRNAAYEIVGGKGYTSFGIATAVVRICEAIVRDEHSVLPVSVLVSGQFGMKGICLSLPCVVGADGVERILLPALERDEIEALRASAAILRTADSELNQEQGTPAKELE
jgi:L-lactate dehydrogenase